ncbi:MAG: hypothetical protein LBG80_05325 [Bacteroidales bacterium]|jgi:hypothetical protein|nr:hypothetical protein [Bacteroidales bacterium]
MNCFTSYCYCAGFGNIQTGEVLTDFGTLFAVSTVKTTNNLDNILIISRLTQRERERERDDTFTTHCQTAY